MAGKGGDKRSNFSISSTRNKKEILQNSERTDQYILKNTF